MPSNTVILEFSREFVRWNAGTPAREEIFSFVAGRSARVRLQNGSVAEIP